MKMEHLRQSFNLLDYDVNEIRVIYPQRSSITSLLIYSGSDLDQICQKYDGQANIYIGINERTDIHAVNFVVVDVVSWVGECLIWDSDRTVPSVTAH